MIPVLVINLERSPERRAAMVARLDAVEIPHVFFTAIDGRSLSETDRERAAPRQELAYSIPLMPSEIACGMSHLAAIREGSRLDCDFFCVLEDDVIPDSQLALWLDCAMLAALPAFDVLRLFTHLDRWEKPSQIVRHVHDRIVVRVLRPGWGAQGQIYSREGARKIIAKLTAIRAPFDYALYHDCHVSGLKVLEVRPGLVMRDFSHETTIGDRPPLSGQETLAERVRRNTHRVRRKCRAAVSFFRAWGVKEFFSFFSLWR